MTTRQNSELPFVSPHAQPYGPEASAPTSRLKSFINRPVSAHIHSPLHARYPFVASKPRRAGRLRLFSDPSSTRSRPSITEIEKGYTGQTSASSSRSVSEVGSDETRVTHLMWNSVFEPLKLSNLNTPKRPAASRTDSMRRVTSCTSMNSVGSLASVTGYDPHDPRITGKLKEKGTIQLPSPEDGQKFILLLSEALMKFGAPSHRIESQLNSVGILLGIKTQVFHMPGVTIVSFENYRTNPPSSDTYFVKSSTKIDLGRLHDVHALYKGVVHYQKSAEAASKELKVLLKKEPIYGISTQILLGCICGLILSPMAYKGSVLDLMAAGLCCGVISWLHLWAAKKNQMFAYFVEITSATFVAFTARALSSLPDGIFCYSAIASTGIVKLLPKYLIICGALEIASKQVMPGSVKMVYAIIWSLFLGFAITMGSDFYYLIDYSARERRFRATQYLSDALNIRGLFSVDNTFVQGTFAFTNVTTPTSTRLYSANGCYRSKDWPWYLQSPPTWTLLFLVPLYSIFSAFASFQPLKSRELPVMILVSCCSYAANRGVHILIPSRGDISGAIGAFVIGVMGHLYSRIFQGTAFIAMFNGIGFLVPSAIAATGGMAQNYRGKSGSHYTSSLELAMSMIQVALGTTVGLFTSSLVVYSFGTKKRGALWAF